VSASAAPPAPVTAPTPKSDFLRLGINEAATEIGVVTRCMSSTPHWPHCWTTSGKKVVIRPTPACRYFGRSTTRSEFDFAFGKSVHVVLAASSRAPMCRCQETRTLCCRLCGDHEQPSRSNVLNPCKTRIPPPTNTPYKTILKNQSALPSTTNPTKNTNIPKTWTR